MPNQGESNGGEHGGGQSTQPSPSADSEQQQQSNGAKPSNDSSGAITRNLNALKERIALTDILMVIATIVIAGATIWNVIYVRGQLEEMHSGGVDTHNLAIATQHLADAARIQAKNTGDLVGAAQAQADAMEKLRQAGEEQAGAMDKLRIAGESQAKATENLAQAGLTQATATGHLAENSARQLGAIQTSADAAKLQAAAVQKQADAAIIASKATDRLADAGQAQSKAVLQSLDVAKAANDIATRAATAADRPWISISMPGDVEPTAGQDYKVDLNISNVGRSPAFNAFANINFDIIPTKKTFPSLDKCTGQCPSQSYTVFPTSGAFNASTIGYHPTLPAARMTAEQVKRINDKTDSILLQVRIDYVDTSGTAHFTESCNALIPKFGFTSCNGSNGAN